MNDLARQLSAFFILAVLLCGCECRDSAIPKHLAPYQSCPVGTTVTLEQDWIMCHCPREVQP